MANLSNYSPPPGSRFLPSDVELVMYYLKRKVMGRKFKLQRDIPDIALKYFSPSEVREMSYPKTKYPERFFFSSLGSRYSKGQRKNRSGKDGFWKPTAKDKPIYSKSRKVGWRRTRTFYLGKPPGTITDWHVHEYGLEGEVVDIQKGRGQNRSGKGGFWKLIGTKAIHNKSHKVGWRSTLTFYRGTAPETITDWHIHESRLEYKELPIASNYQNEFVVLCKIFEKKSRGPKTDEDYESPVEEDADDCVNCDDQNGSLVPFLSAIPSSSIGPEEGQNTVATISALHFESRQDTVLQPLPPHSATPIVPQHHPSSPENDVHKLLLNVSDEDGDTCDGGGNIQVDSVPNKRTGEDVDTNDIYGTLVDIIDWEKEVLSQGLTGGFLEEEDLNKPMEDEEG